MLNHEDALRVLGLIEGASQAEIEEAHRERSESISRRRANAATPEQAARFERALAEVDEARGVLLGQTAPGGAQASSRPSGSSLSATQMQDLPGLGPSLTSGDWLREAGESAQLEAGSVLAQRYEIRRRIGVGGMGAVYSAFDPNRGKEIAIKVLLPRLVESDQARERFFSEGRIASDLSHPNILNVYDPQREGKLAFLTMELLEGRTLREEIEARKSRGETFSVAETIEIGRSTAEALAYAHQFTVHRDVKPENIFLCQDGRIKLMDFGIARILTGSQLTMTGMALGTAYYMAPEQLKGSGTVDPRADQYSLAVVLYELLTGQIPQGAIQAPRQLRAEVPSGLSAAVIKALSPQPEMRFADMGALVAALAPSRPLVTLPGGESAKKLGIAAGVVLALVFLVFAWPSISTLLPDREATERARGEAIKAQAALEELHKRVEVVGRRIEEDARAAKTAADRIAERIPQARTAEERGELMRRLKSAREEAEVAEAIQSAAQRGFFSSSVLVNIKASQAVGDAGLKEGRFLEAAEALAGARKDLQGTLDNLELLPRLVVARREMEGMVEQVARILRDQGVDPQTALATARDQLVASDQRLETGDVSAALDELGRVGAAALSGVRPAFETLIAAHGTRAKELMSHDRLSEAEQALGQAKRAKAQLEKLEKTLEPSNGAVTKGTGSNGGGRGASATGAEPSRAVIDLGGSPVRGDGDAPVTVVAWFDLQCPFCGRVQPTLEKILETYRGQVRIVFKHLPLNIHSEARAAHYAAEAAHRQGRFWEMHDRIFERQYDVQSATLEGYARDLGLDMRRFSNDVDSEGVRSRVEEELEQAKNLGASGTPAFFINGRSLPGAQPFENFVRVIDEELRRVD
ncbi:thioredoxin domain-containing protein [Myxococcota bacterium]|nr:thioredoxin domain-containing protein [Myxococcota bacterium]